MRTRIVTINLAGTKDDWFGKRRSLMIEGLRELNADIVCLQETTLIRGYEPYDQARDVGEAIGLPVVAFAPYGNPIEVMSHEQGGVAIISKWPIRRVRNRRLPSGHETPPDSRVALYVALETPIGEIKVVTTHLSWEPDGTQVRLMQMGLIMDELFQGNPLGSNARVVVTGDLNAIDTEPVIGLVRECLIDSYRQENPKNPGYTWALNNPLTGRMPIANRRLDYIFCPESTKLRESRIVLDSSPGGQFASDHFGVLADIEWPDAEEKVA